MDKVGDEFVPTEGQPKMKEKRSMSMKQQGVRVVRCAGRNDRHSKVCTARGIRDRRVRLSPKTAILFYDVQDRLGCDRPSKAIDWLIKEAKAAIDALDHPPAPPPPPNYTNAAASPEYHHHMFKFECSNDHNILPISGFGFPFNGGAPPPPFVTPELQALAARSESEAGEEYYQQQFLSAPTPLGLFDANSEIVRLQRILSWNYANADFHYPAPADFHEREPLQSSYSRINSNYPQLIQGFGFPDQEMPNFKEDDINLRQPPS